MQILVSVKVMQHSMAPNMMITFIRITEFGHAKSIPCPASSCFSLIFFTSLTVLINYIHSCIKIDTHIEFIWCAIQLQLSIVVKDSRGVPFGVLFNFN